MPMASIRRRVGRLMESACFQIPREYPPLTRAEVEDLADRVRTGDLITNDEIDHVESQGSVVRGEYIMRVCGGEITYKRYVGVDLEAVL